MALGGKGVACKCRGWHIPKGGWLWLLVDDQQGGGANQRSRSPWNHWSFNTTSRLSQRQRIKKKLDRNQKDWVDVFWPRVFNSASSSARPPTVSLSPLPPLPWFVQCPNLILSTQRPLFAAVLPGGGGQFVTYLGQGGSLWRIGFGRVDLGLETFFSGDEMDADCTTTKVSGAF